MIFADLVTRRRCHCFFQSTGEPSVAALRPQVSTDEVQTSSGEVLTIEQCPVKQRRHLHQLRRGGQFHYKGVMNMRSMGRVERRVEIMGRMNCLLLEFNTLHMV